MASLSVEGKTLQWNTLASGHVSSDLASARKWGERRSANCVRQYLRHNYCTCAQQYNHVACG
eukprot:5737990-Amphidinium_carterae.2